MEFRVTRISEWDDETSPCEGAYKDEFTIVDIQCFASFEEFKSHYNKSFLADGSNHELTSDGCIYRELRARPRWKIEIQDLEHLQKFSQRHGKIIVSGEHLEIYDNYRE